MKLESAGLIMEPIQNLDWDLFMQLHSPQVLEQCFDPPSEAELRVKFKSRLSRWSPASEAWLTMVIREKLTNKPVGVTGFCLNQGIAEVGYLLLPEFHGLGYGTESLARLIDWSRDFHEISKYRAVVTQGNIASERVLEKCGFGLTQVIPGAHKIAGRQYDNHVYVLENKRIRDSDT